MGAQRQVDEQEMEARLREAFSHDPESSLLRVLGRCISDPARMRDANDWPHFHPLFLIIALAGLMAIGVFLYFSFSRF